MTLDFQFDEAVHAYVVDNQLQPHVTGILQAYGIIDYSGALPEDVERKNVIGTAVHRATHYIDEDGMPLTFAVEAVADEYAEQMERHQLVLEDLLGYGFAWVKFCADSEFQCLPGFCERRHVAEVNGMTYGMTIDRAGILRKRHTILDLKCTAGTQKSWPVQLSGYALGLPKPAGLPRWDRANVWLKPDGTYALLPGGRRYTDRVTERRDEEVFLAALRLTWWKRENLDLRRSQPDV